MKYLQLHESWLFENERTSTLRVTLYSLLYTLSALLYTPYSQICTLYSLLATVCSVPSALYPLPSTRCSPRFILFARFSVRSILFSLLFIPNFLLSTTPTLYCNSRGEPSTGFPLGGLVELKTSQNLEFHVFCSSKENRPRQAWNAVNTGLGVTNTHEDAIYVNQSLLLAGRCMAVDREFAYISFMCI